MSLSQDFARIFASREMTDASLELFNQVIPVHSLVVSARSTVLREALSHYAEQNPLVNVDDIIVRHVPPLLQLASLANAFEACVVYMYTDEVDEQHCHHLSLPALFHCAQQLCLPGLTKALEDRVADEINPAHACRMWALMPGCSPARQYIVQNFSDIFDAFPNSFADLSSSQIITLLRDDRLATGSGGEEIAWELVSLWGRGQVLQHRSNLRKVLSRTDMLAYVKLPLLSASTLTALRESKLLPPHLESEAFPISSRSTPLYGPANPGTAVWRRIPRAQLAADIGSPQSPHRVMSPFMSHDDLLHCDEHSSPSPTTMDMDPRSCTREITRSPVSGDCGRDSPLFSDFDPRSPTFRRSPVPSVYKQPEASLRGSPRFVHIQAPAPHSRGNVADPRSCTAELTRTPMAEPRSGSITRLMSPSVMSPSCMLMSPSIPSICSPWRSPVAPKILKLEDHSSPITEPKTFKRSALSEVTNSKKKGAKRRQELSHHQAASFTTFII
eukprot:NODE_1018_length_1938_cov_63.030303_g967_i0.p1 GENE.NODE_1018_length_1938_cov_63.030303_g967_i0~~NODE_1018_length_1938_cov_63.030303_g967_i0.p1  ORF type:complete len:500 (-),score=78.43 NODE_1018_length_1938_cov_63.030303_g967_i0:368-1867(-)